MNATLAVGRKPLNLSYYLRLLVEETRSEFTAWMRRRAYSLSTIGFPVMFYLLFGTLNRQSAYATYLLAGYSCFGMVAACLFGIGMSVSNERMQGWLDLKLASPMPRWAYLLAKIFSCAAFGLIVVTLLLIIGVTLDGVHVNAAQVAGLYGVALVGTIPFAAMGLLIALTVVPNAAAGVINMIYLPMSFLSGLWIPLRYLPHWIGRIAPSLPAYHYGQLALRVFGYAQPGSMALHWESLAAFTCLMLGGAWWIFSRSEARQ